MTLYNKTLELIKTRPRNLTFAEIEKRTGIKQSWLRAFSQGKIKDPSVNLIQSLYEFLTNTKLKV